MHQTLRPRLWALDGAWPPALSSGHVGDRQSDVEKQWHQANCLHRNEDRSREEAALGNACRSLRGVAEVHCSRRSSCSRLSGLGFDGNHGCGTLAPMGWIHTCPALRCCSRLVLAAGSMGTLQRHSWRRPRRSAPYLRASGYTRFDAAASNRNTSSSCQAVGPAVSAPPAEVPPRRAMSHSGQAEPKLRHPLGGPNRHRRRHRALRLL